jgi:hypothetical protein
MKIKACKWNAETVIDCAIKYKSWKDFSENGPSAAYAAARYLNLIPEIVSQMEHPFYGNQIYSGRHRRSHTYQHNEMGWWQQNTQHCCQRSGYSQCVL